MKHFAFLFLLAFLFCALLVQAANVPQAVKYQAVVRDLEGEPLLLQKDIDVKVNIHLGSELGDKVYSEYHLGMESNMFGMIYFEIGRGTLEAGSKNFDQIDWGAASHYIQLELQVASNPGGYTQMGFSELLSVPYALYAGNSSGGADYSLLQDNVLPRYNKTLDYLVPSNIRQEGGDLIMDPQKIQVSALSVEIQSQTSELNASTDFKIISPSIRFQNPNPNSDPTKKASYTFPNYAVDSGFVLALVDYDGNLGWRKMEGGAGGGGGGGKWTSPYFPYWDATLDAAKAGTIKQADPTHIEIESHLFVKDSLITGKVIKAGTELIAPSIQINPGNDGSGDFVFNGSLRGIHNIMTNDLLSGKIWLGDATNKAIPSLYSFPLFLAPQDGMGLTYNAITQSLEWKSSNSPWSMKDDTIYNNGNLAKILIGIGTVSPQAKLHIQDGAGYAKIDVNKVEIGENIKTAGVSSFTFGKDVTAAEGSIVFGNNAKAVKNAILIGMNTEATEEGNLVLGRNGVAHGASSFSIGGGKVLSTTGNNMAIGEKTEISGISKSSMLIGTGPLSTMVTGANNVIAIGNDIAISSGGIPPDNAVAIGSALTITSPGIAIGKGHTLSDSDVDDPNNQIYNKSIIIGKDCSSKGKGLISFGMGLNSVIKAGLSGGINIGIANAMSIGTVTDESAKTMIGYHLIASGGRSITIGGGIENDVRHCIALGVPSNSTTNALVSDDADIFAQTHPAITDFNAINNAKGVNMIVYAGSTAPNMMLTKEGHLKIKGNLYAETVHSPGGLITSSDSRLKENIKSLNPSLSFLDKVQAVFYNLISSSGGVQYGFIAQNVKDYFPDLVVGDEQNGYLGLKYDGFIPILWKYTQMQQEQLDLQQNKIEALENEIAAIKAAIKELKTK